MSVNGGSSLRSWTDTRTALRSLQDLLKCKKCDQVFSHPVTLNTCGHTFCSSCCESLASCPECEVPVWTKDMVPSFKLNNIIGAAADIGRLISVPSATSMASLVVVSPSYPSSPSLLVENIEEEHRTKAAGVGVGVRRRVKRPERTQSIARMPVVKLNRVLSDCSNAGEHIASGGARTRWLATKLKEVMPTLEPLSGRDLVRNLVKGGTGWEDRSPVEMVESPGISHRLRSSGSLSSSRSSLASGQRPRNSRSCRKREAVDSAEEKVPIRKVKRHAKEKRNVKGETPLHLAAIKGDKSQVKLLLEHGADPNMKDHAGWTPLHDASHHGHSAVVSLLLEGGALVDVPGYSNNTALHEAVANNCPQVTRLLLHQGASTTLKNCYGQTARDMGHFHWIDQMFSHTSERPLATPTLRTMHASPELNGSVVRVVILGTGLRPHHRAILADAASHLNAEVTNRFSPEVTHVVACAGSEDSCLRTYKLLCGMATGKWVVKFEWIQESLSRLQWVDETSYEVSGVRTVDGTRSLAACKRARENQLFGAPGLFDGCHFYLHGSFHPPQPSREELTHLLLASDAAVLNREPNLDPGILTHPYHTSPECGRSVFILVDSDSSCKAKVQKWRPVNSDESSSVGVVSVGWVLDCLTQFRLLQVHC